MRHASRRRAREHRQRLAVLKRAHGPQRCAWPPGCVRAADDGHELLSRARGGSITDPANIVPLCREHHDWVTVHPSSAADLGLALPSSRVRHDDEFRARIAPVSDTATHSPKIAVRLAQSGVAWLDTLAGETGKTRTDAIRACLRVAAAHEREVRAALTAPTPTRRTDA